MGANLFEEHAIRAFLKSGWEGTLPQIRAVLICLQYWRVVGTTLENTVMPMFLAPKEKRVFARSTRSAEPWECVMNPTKRNQSDSKAIPKRNQGDPKAIPK